ncbi:MAG: glycosyltransferase [Anaerolineae bacterium]
MSLIPIALFAYARPDHLQRTLDGLRANGVPKIYAFSDGARTPEKADAVEAVRAILRAVDWCEIEIVERERNYGLGVSIRKGVSEVLQRHEAVIVYEDDLVCLPGTYAYLCAALEHYRDDHRVRSVTGWTHPRVTPEGVGDQPYFDGRAECWTWGTWRRGWEGMDTDALSLLEEAKSQGIDPNRYGADLPVMAKEEAAKNIWAVRWLYLHIARGGLCLRPHYSMVEHIGFDALATNAVGGDVWANPPLRPVPPIPAVFPDAIEHVDCVRLWQRAYGSRPPRTGLFWRGIRKLQRTLQRR